MPIQRCTKNGKKGWQYGDQKCYTGKNAKEKAKEQMKAIKASQARRNK